VNPAGQLQLNPLAALIQVAPFRQGLGKQASTNTEHLVPVYPGEQLHL